MVLMDNIVHAKILKALQTRDGPEPFTSDRISGDFNVWLLSCEPPHDKTIKMICAPSENSDQT